MKWIQIYDVAALKDEEVRYYLDESHRIVSLGLRRRCKKRWG